MHPPTALATRAQHNRHSASHQSSHTHCTSSASTDTCHTVSRDVNKPRPFISDPMLSVSPNSCQQSTLPWPLFLTLASPRPFLYTVVVVLVCVTDWTFFFAQTLLFPVRHLVEGLVNPHDPKAPHSVSIEVCRPHYSVLLLRRHQHHHRQRRYLHPAVVVVVVVSFEVVYPLGSV